nr:hypothetical protein Iba_chr13cCG7970 [Ipomoea batatas]
MVSRKNHQGDVLVSVVTDKSCEDFLSLWHKVRLKNFKVPGDDRKRLGADGDVFLPSAVKGPIAATAQKPDLEMDPSASGWEIVNENGEGRRQSIEEVTVASVRAQPQPLPPWVVCTAAAYFVDDSSFRKKGFGSSKPARLMAFILCEHSLCALVDCRDDDEQEYQEKSRCNLLNKNKI